MRNEIKGMRVNFGGLSDGSCDAADADLRRLVHINLFRAESEWHQIRHVIASESEGAAGIDTLRYAAPPLGGGRLGTPRRRGAVGESGNERLVISGESVTKTLIPGYPVLDNDRPTVGEFVAFVADMRNSSARFSESAAFPHVRCGLQRIFYETSALIPAIAHTAARAGGQATELLGDGVLILFHIPPGKREQVIANACAAAKRCIDCCVECVNDLLWRRHALPPLKVGIGLACGPAIVKVVDANGKHPKVIGQCIWEATKLSGGENTIGLSLQLQGFLRTYGRNENFEVIHA